MEVCVSGPSRSLRSVSLPASSIVGELVQRFSLNTGVPAEDMYVTRDGRRAELHQVLQHGAVYRLELRLQGGKGGFGSMLRALGAQIEKTTNREACRDLSGRRLRDVNHEKEMADWLQKQAEREAEREQRRTERLQRKLSEPKHRFSDQQYMQQCADLSERLEESVIKGMQASSSGLVSAEAGPRTKRTNQQADHPPRKRKCLWWTGVGELDDLVSSEEESDEGSAKSQPGTSGTIQQSRDEQDRAGKDPEHPAAPSTLQMTAREDPAAPSTLQVTAREDPAAPSTLQVTAREDPAAPSTLQVTAREDPAAPSTLQVTAREDPATPSTLQVTAREDPAAPSTLQMTAREDPAAPSTLQVTAREDPAAPSTLQMTAREDPAAPSGGAGAVPPPAISQQALGPLDLEAVVSAEALGALGLEVLKVELSLRGLKCGGTLTERAERLFSVKGLRPDQIKPALLARKRK